MEQSELLRRLVTEVERLGLQYLITGSAATILYGEPRLTNDIDIVVVLPASRVAEFCRSFPAPEFYVDEESAMMAVHDHGQFNILHPNSGLKVDVMVPPETPFNRARFARGARVKPAADYEATFASPEDVIIKKMEYFNEGGSEKHLRDIAGVLRITGDRIDLAYITEWALRLGLADVWEAVLRRVNA